MPDFFKRTRLSFLRVVYLYLGIILGVLHASTAQSADDMIFSGGRSFPTASYHTPDAVKRVLLSTKTLSLKRIYVYRILELDFKPFVDVLFDPELHQNRPLSRLITYAFITLHADRLSEAKNNPLMLQSMLALLSTDAYDADIIPSDDDVKVRLIPPSLRRIVLLDVLIGMARMDQSLKRIVLSKFNLDILLAGTNDDLKKPGVLHKYRQIFDAVHMIHEVEPLYALHLVRRLEPYVESTAKEFDFPRDLSSELRRRFEEVKTVVFRVPQASTTELLSQMERRACALLEQGDDASVQLGLELLEEVQIFEIETIMQLVLTADKFPDLEEKIYRDLSRKAEEVNVLHLWDRQRNNATIYAGCSRLYEMKRD